jgi:hypothetical protein
MGGATSKFDLNGKGYIILTDKEYDIRNSLLKQRVESKLEVLFMSGYIEINVTDIIVSGYSVVFSYKRVYENLKNNIPKPFIYMLVCEPDGINLRISLINNLNN